MSQEDEVQREMFSLATHLYARLRRAAGRSIDVVWLMSDEPYAREILRLAFASNDVQMHEYAARFSELIGGKAATKSPAAARQPPPEPVDLSVEERKTIRPLNRYVGSLR